MSFAPDELVGTTVQERYRILEFLAEGAMGSVYRAERIGLERQVAIKFLSPNVGASSPAKKRFEREAKAMSRLDHPNCVSVIDFGVAPAPYIVMEYVTGQTLRERIDSGPVSVERAIYLCSGILAGLAHAHKQDIIHRDIKPANVMITEAAGTQGLVRILDFGLAKLHGDVGSDISAAWMVVGTPNYMSPEQGAGGALDHRTDLYSVAVLLFELLTGCKPFEGNAPFSTLLKHREEPIPRLAATAPERAFPAGLQEVVDRGLAKEPAERFASAMDFREALGAVGCKELATEPEAATDQQPAGAAYAATLQVETLSPATSNEAEAQSLVEELTSQVDQPSSPKRSGRWLLLGALALALAGGASAMALGLAQDDSVQGVSPLPTELDKTVSQAPVGELALRSAQHQATATAAPAPDAGLGAPQQALLEALSEGILADGGDLVSETDAAPGFSMGSLDAGLVDAPLNPEEAALAEFGEAGEEAEEDEDEDEAEEDEAIEEPLSADEMAADEVDVDPPSEVESPAPSRVVRNVQDARKLVAQGERGAAIAGLRKLSKKNPRSASIHLLLGNLYFEQRWWSVALEQYALSIRKDRKYRRKPVLIDNSIRALGSSKTRRRASNFLRKEVGKPALPKLRRAAKRDKSPLVRKGAAYLVRRVGAKARPGKRRSKRKTRRKGRRSWMR